MNDAAQITRAEAALIAARVRAAIAYCGLRTESLAGLLGDDLGIATLRRITSVTKPRGASLAELWRIADACQAPRSWFERGEWIEGTVLETPLGQGSAEDRLEAVEHYLEVLLNRVGGVDRTPRSTSTSGARGSGKSSSAQGSAT